VPRGPPGGRRKASSPARARVLAGSTGRAATRGGCEVIEFERGITVYPARSEGGRWRAVWHEGGEWQQCEAATEEKLAPKLENVAERLQADAPNMRRPGADLIAHHLNPDRLPVQDRWSRRHADTQRRPCERFVAPVIATVTSQDISVAGESARWVDPAEIPADSDIAKLGLALAVVDRGDLYVLMANTAAYSGQRWGELTALTIPQIGQAARAITVDRKSSKSPGTLLEAPKNRKQNRTIYPRRTPGPRRAPKPMRRLLQRQDG
jgi:hypothetical protein